MKELVETMKDDIKQAISDHHLEMIKQFYLMQVTNLLAILLATLLRIAQLFSKRRVL